MNSELDESYDAIPADMSSQPDDSSLVGSQNQEAVADDADTNKARTITKRPFLKRGSRMPVSKIPPDPFTAVVKPIKNPPNMRPTNISSLEPHDLERARIDPRDSPARLDPAPRKTIAVLAPQTSTREEPKQPAIDDLETYLRDMSNSVISVADHLRGVPDTSTNYTNPRLTSAQRPSSRLSIRENVPLETSSRATTSRSRVSRPVSQNSTRAYQTAYDDSIIEADMKKKLKELDDQIAKFKKENEYCKKLRLERETALAEAQRTRERALAELEAAEKDIQEQRSQLAAERKRIQQDKDRGRTLTTQMRDLADENRSLKEKLAETEVAMADKVNKLKAEIVRLTGTVSDLMQTKSELEAARSTLKTLAIEPAGGADGSESGRLSNVYTHPDGRIDRQYMDGRREAVFPSGLRKTVWPDGSALVRFPNGDVKQTSAAGVVTYQYAATGCVQTTQPDGVEVLQFPSGQVEKHFADGTKEIRFPSGIVKRLDPSGHELPN
jgi:hypothetical protein